MTRKFRRLLGATLASISVAAAAQMLPPYGPAINLDNARKVAAAAEAEARKNNWNATIAVVDTGGHLVYLLRLDGAQYATIPIATQKAQSAVAHRRPTKMFEDAVKGGNPQVANLPTVIAVEGGVPLIADGRVIGAIGVSGTASAQDGQIAGAGAGALR